MLVRIILNARYFQYGFFLLPLAVFFLLQLMVVEAARPAPQSLRPNWLLPVAITPLVLICSGAMLWASLGYYSLKTMPVGVGRDRFYALPDSYHVNGWQLNTMLEAFSHFQPKPKSLLVLPEGIAVNYHLRVPSPLKELELTPFGLAYADPQEVLKELQAHPPEVIFLHGRDLSEYGVNFFGANKAAGQDILDWIKEHYYVAGSAGVSRYNFTGHGLDFLALKPTANPTPASPPAKAQ